MNGQQNVKILLNSFNHLSIITKIQCPILEIGNKRLNFTTHIWELGAGLGNYFKQDEITQNITQKLAEPVRIQN